MARKGSSQKNEEKKAGFIEMTIYFDHPGYQNTKKTLELAAQKAREEKIDTIVLASTSGQTALKALDIGKGLKIISVGSYRSRSLPEKFAEFERKGGKVVFAYDDVSYEYPQEAQARFREIAGEGGKVAIEVVVVATIASLIKEGEKVIGIGGTYPGADTAFVISATKEFAEEKVLEVICQPKK